MNTVLDRDDLVFKPPELGCVLYLPGLPAGNGKIHDRSPYGNHGAITGATWVRLPSGLWCLSFDGSDDVVTVATNPGLDLTTFSIAMWCKTDNAGTMQTAISKRNGTTAGWSLDFRGDSVGEFYLVVSNGGVWGNLQSDSQFITDTAWHHIVCTYRAATKTANFYIDGVSAGGESWTTQLVAATSTDVLIGEYGNDEWDGNLALVRFSSNIMTAFDAGCYYHREKHLFGR